MTTVESLAENPPNDNGPKGPFLNLGRDGGNQFLIDANTVATGRTCVIGTSGSGKSYAVGVICEELCKTGVPFAIIDVEGEYSGVKAKYEAIWIGEDDQSDFKWSTLDSKELAEQAPDIAPLILDVSELDNPRERVSDLLTGIYKEVEKRRTPYLIIMEEADRFVPQTGDKLPIFGEVARRGRKRGIGLMVCTQRPSVVDKNILSQCGNQLIGKLVIRNDLESVAQFFSGRELPKQLTTLEPGNFYALGGLSPEPKLVRIRQRETHPGGETPKLTVRIVKQFKPSRGQTSGQATQPGLLGINPSITEQEAIAMVGRSKSFLFFGKEEVVTSVRLQFWPLAELAVRMRSGLVRKRFETVFLVLNGMDGRSVELGERLVFRPGFEDLLGLEALNVATLRALSSGEDSSIEDVSSKMGVTKASLRKSLKLLGDRRLVRSSRLGRATVYRRLLDLPKVSWKEQPLSLEPLKTPNAVVQSPKLTESDVREIVKGLHDDTDLERFTQFLYPVYRIELALGKKSRQVWIDGCSADEVKP